MPAFTQSNTVLEADYTKSKIEIYQDIIPLAITQTSSLEFLSAVQHRKLIDASIPSWLPIWDQLYLRQGIIYSSAKLWSDVTLDTVPSIAIDSPAHILRVRGLKLAEITDRKITYLQKYHDPEPIPNPQKIELLQYCIAARTPESHYLTGESMIDVILTVFVAGHYSTRMPDDILQIRVGFTTLLKLLLRESGMDTSQLPELFSCEDEGDPKKFEDFACRAGVYRAIFKTSKGYLGLGPDTLHVGDVAVVLFGGKVPYILRRKDGHYQFVGEAYIHGIMRGEMVQKWRDGQLLDEEFGIH